LVIDDRSVMIFRIPPKRSIETNASSDYSIARHSWAVASMTESEPRVESEKASDSALGQPGQRHEAGKAFGCSV